MLPAEAAVLRQSLRQQIITVSPDTFESLALAIFWYQATYNPVYGDYVRHLNIRPDSVTDLNRVPFMPIDFFKRHTILTGRTEALPIETLTFASSGTTNQEQNSRHMVPDVDLYNAVSTRIFEQVYGPLNHFHILALLPSYLERNNSSLVYMVQQFMAQTGHTKTGSPAAESTTGFYLNNHGELTEQIRYLTDQLGRSTEPDKKILLIGVTFGLLDWAESNRNLTFLGDNPNLIVMETGGMKGRRKELLREEVHEILTNRLGVSTIHSEYGMTELLSQAYSTGNGVFQSSPTLRIFLRDINDPFTMYPDNHTQTGARQTGERRTGGINVVDLANLDSCSFIETQDLGQYVGDEGAFSVIGRFDNSDVRGCNLMIL